MYQLKRISFLTAMALGAAFTSAMATPVNYGKTAVTGASKNWGTTKSEAYDVAVSIDDPTMRGAKITGITVPMYTVEGLTNPSAFITRTLATENVDGVRKNAADVETVKASFDGNKLTATFAEGFTLGESPVYVGFSFEIETLTAENRTPLTGMAAVNNGGFFIRTARTYPTWKDRCESENFTSGIIIQLEGDFSSTGAALRLDDMKFCQEHKGFDLPVIFVNQGTEPVSTIDYTWKLGDETGSGQYVAQTPFEVEFGREYPLSFYIDSDADKGYKDITVSLDKINGTTNLHPDRTATRQIRVVSLVPVRRPLVEEYTGTWCGFCTRGIASMEHMRNVYGDEFVGIAYHQPASAPEPMYCVDYVPNTPPGLPKAYIDRIEQVDPYHGALENGSSILPKDYGFIRAWQRYADKFSPAAVSVKANWDETNPDRINIETSVAFVDETPGEFGIEYVVTADGLKGTDPTDSSWLQKNQNQGVECHISEMEQFARGGMYMMIEYNDVALKRSGVSPVPNSLPTNMETDIAYTHNYQMSCGSVKGYTGQELVQDRSKLRVAALVINKSTGEVVNSVQTKVTSSTNVDCLSGLETETAVEYYDLNGLRIERPDKGLFIKLTRYSNGNTFTEKIYAR